MPQSAETVPVEMQAAELPFLPFAAAANVASAPVQFIFPVFLLFFLPVNRIGKGMPGKRHLPAKAQSKQIRLILIIPRRHRCPPYLCEQALRQSPVPADDQRLRKFLSRKHTDSGKDLLVRIIPGIPQHQERMIPFHHGRICESPRFLRRNIMQYGKLQHPPAQISAHSLIPETGVQEPLFELLHFLQTFLRRSHTDPAQQFIQIDISKGYAYRLIISFAKPGPPGKVSAQLPDSQIVIHRKIMAEGSLPGGVILILFHKSGLPDKDPALPVQGIVSVFKQLQHLMDLLRKRRLRILPGGPEIRPQGLRKTPENGVSEGMPPSVLSLSVLPCLSACARSRCRLLPAAWLAGSVLLPAAWLAGSVRMMYVPARDVDLSAPAPSAPAKYVSRISPGPAVSARKQSILIRFSLSPLRFPAVIQHDRDAFRAFTLNAHSRIKHPEDCLRLRVPFNFDTSPVCPLHSEGRRYPGYMKAVQCLLPAFDIAPLDLLPEIVIPLAHQKSDPFSRGRLCQNRKSRKISPFVLFPDIIFFFGISRQF